jgi:hypothetical protein
VRDQALCSGGVHRSIVGGDRGQSVDVPVEHAKHGRDQHRVVNLHVRRARCAGLGDVFGGNGEAAAGWRRGYREQGLQLGGYRRAAGVCLDLLDHCHAPGRWAAAQAECDDAQYRQSLSADT